MELHIRLEGGKGLADQLYQQLRAGIDSGHLAAGSQLPPTRLLAEQLGVSRKTVADVELLITRVRKVELGLYSLAPFFSEVPVRPGLLLGFGAIELLDIDPALDRVADTLRQIS